MIRLMLGDCRDSLRSLPASSVQATISSPPYYGLRDYGLPPLVWGGDPRHAHEWESQVRSLSGGGYGPASTLAGFTNPKTKGRQLYGGIAVSQGACQCGAWLGSHGLEPTPELYVQHEVEVFREVRRVLRDDGVLWLNLGDSYAGSGKGPSNSLQNGASCGVKMGSVHGDSGHTSGVRPPAGLKSKDLMMMPFRAAMALQADGWYVRSCIPWLKRNSMPESVTDRPSSAVEYVFLLAKSAKYFWDADAVRSSNSANPRGMAFYAKKGIPMPTGPRKAIQQAHKDAGEKAMNAYQYGSDGPVEQIGRNRRNSDWFFESWQGLLCDEDDPLALVVNPQPFSGAHFATFPPKLVEPMVKASTSEKGQCPDCGAPWVRETATRYEKGYRTGHLGRYRGDANGMVDRSDLPALDKIVSTTGWRASCAHADLDPLPQTILDCFGGAGTVGLVADRLGRDALLMDLKPDYHLMAETRVVQDAPLFVQLEAGL